MKYIFLTLQYLFRLDNGKRFIYLLLFALPACLVIAYYFPITGYFEWFFNYTGDYTSYTQLWLSLLERDTLKIGILFAGYILLILSVSTIVTTVIRSLRIGKFQIKSIFYLMNENFFPALYLMTFFILSLLLFQSIICLFLFLWQNLESFLLSYLLSLSFTIICLIGVAFIYSGLTLWLPIMSINGLKPFKAMGVSYTKSHKARWQLFVAVIIPLAVIIAIGFISFLFRNIWYISWALNALNYAFSTVYFTSLAILSYFEIENITREDLVKRPYLRR